MSIKSKHWVVINQDDYIDASNDREVVQMALKRTFKLDTFGHVLGFDSRSCCFSDPWTNDLWIFIYSKRFRDKFIEGLKPISVNQKFKVTLEQHS